MTEDNDWSGVGELVGVRERQAQRPPPMYKVLLLNDDFTPMDFVVDVLQKYFSFDVQRATQLMLSVHYQGRAICGIFSAEIAETKVTMVNQYAREHDYPLLCAMEKV